MNPQVVRDILGRLGRLEKQSVRYRQGVVTSTSPLSVALGGSDFAYASVRVLEGASVAAGDVVAVATFGGDLLVLGAISGTGQVPHARVYNNVAIPIANNTPTALTFNSERYDSDGLHSTVTNTGRLTCGTPGEYALAGSVEWPSNATGSRAAWLRVTGSVIVASDSRNAVNGAVTQQPLSTTFRLAAGDYLELVVLQTSGAGLNVSAVGSYSPEMSMVWLGP